MLLLRLVALVDRQGGPLQGRSAAQALEVGGGEQDVHRVWLALERGGRVLKESKVESPGEAIRLSEALRKELIKSNHAA